MAIVTGDARIWVLKEAEKDLKGMAIFIRALYGVTETIYMLHTFM